MRIHFKTNDGRQLDYGGRSRYVVFRLTHQGGYSVTSDTSAEKCVKWAIDKHNERGFPLLVVDSTTGEAIACYPYDVKHLPDGQTDVRHTSTPGSGEAQPEVDAATSVAQVEPLRQEEG